MSLMDLKSITITVLFFIYLLSICATKKGDSNSCFCELRGEVDDCSCKIESLDDLNNKQIYPRLQSLLRKDYFKYIRINLNKQCPFWPDDSRCSLKDCSVNTCSEEDVPSGLKASAYAKEVNEKHDESKEEGCSDKDLDYLNKSISSKQEELFKSWKKFDDALTTFCELDDDSSAGLDFVDLSLNKERYTGYKGESAWRIWKSIYDENCFKPPTIYGYTSSLQVMCLEKRVFYRMISGLHTSINVHLSADYYFAGKGFGKGQWGPNVEEFQNRFNPETTDGVGPHRLKNLYFTYMVELRALVKAAPYLEEEDFFTGDDEHDTDVRTGVRDLIKILRSFPQEYLFDESKLFQGNKKEAKKMKREFRNHFRNISKIMDCVGCDKCKLWGKTQVLGMGTALKILFSGDQIGPDSTVDATEKQKFQLRRTEIVALFNAFGRLSSSIHYVEQFKSLMPP